MNRSQRKVAPRSVPTLIAELAAEDELEDLNPEVAPEAGEINQYIPIRFTDAA